MKRYFVFGVIVPGIIGCFLLAAEARDEKDVPEGDVKAVVTGNSRFAFELYAKLKDDPNAVKQDGNLFFSPYSISAALAMTYAGARGETEKQMAKVLHFTLPQERLHAGFAASGKRMRADPDELRIANSLWGQKDYGFLEDFLELTKKYYGAELKEVDFIKETEKSRKTINKWVEKRTEEKISELIGKGILSRYTVLVLTNAIYFKGDWMIQFDKKNTRDAPFAISADKKVNVPMMYLKEKFKYWANEDLQVLELPYEREHLSMIVLLPKKADGLVEFEKSLTLDNLNNWLAGLRKREVMVYLPRFKITWGAFELKDVLKDMGMPHAFFWPPADFSGMTVRKDLFISNVLHKAFVEVNEEGTEAAAATAVVMTRSVGTVFRANHPFIFMIKDNRAGSILFMGRVVNPAKSEKEVVADNEQMITGTIRRVGVEGGFYGIVADNGQKYDPVNLPSAYRKDGLRVKFQVREKKGMMGFHMWGKIVEIVKIEEQNYK